MQVEEHGSEFEVPLAGGQKTGWFFDQHDNRAACCATFTASTGAGRVQLRGRLGRPGRSPRCAEKSLCVDSSATALEWVADNAAANGVNVAIREADAFDALRNLREPARSSAWWCWIRRLS